MSLAVVGMRGHGRDGPASVDSSFVLTACQCNTRISCSRCRATERYLAWPWSRTADRLRLGVKPSPERSVLRRHHHVHRVSGLHCRAAVFLRSPRPQPPPRSPGRGRLCSGCDDERHRRRGPHTVEVRQREIVSAPQLCAADLAKQRGAIAKAQTPWATIIGCADSRTPPELLFGGVGLGELFVARNAGNMADTATMGTIEYGAEHLGVPLIIVLGHQRCGAVGAACSGGRKACEISGLHRPDGRGDRARGARGLPQSQAISSTTRCAKTPSEPPPKSRKTARSSRV